MYKATAFGFVAMFFYAAQNVTVKHKLDQVEPVVTLAFASGTVFFLSILWILGSLGVGKSIQLPPVELIAFAVGAGVLLFAADLFYYSAYGAGLSVIAATTLPVFIPMFVVCITWGFLNGQKPTLNFYLGIVTAFITLWLMIPKK